MNNLNKLYLSMLEAWGAKMEPDHSLVMVLDGEKYPIKVDGMNVYLPVDTVLDGNTMDKVFFHPACESIISRETEIFKVIRKLTGMKLLDTFKKLPLVLFNIASKRSNKNLRSDLVDIIDPLRDVKEATRKEVMNLFEQMRVDLEENATVDNRFIHFQTTRGGRSKVGGEKICYKAKPIFPFYSEMAKKLNRSEGLPDNQSVDVNGCQISVGGLRIAVGIFKAVFPEIDTPDFYEFEYHHPDAARLCAFSGAYVNVAESINSLQNSFRTEFDKVGVYGLEVGFFEKMDNISEFYKQVPAMNYNSQNTVPDSSSGKSHLIDQVINTQSVINQNQPQQNPQQHIGGDSNNGFRSVVEASMQPGEVYQGWYYDQNTSFYIHTTMSTAGQVSYRITRAGNLLSREYNGVPQQQGMYPGYGQYYQQQYMQPIAYANVGAPQQQQYVMATPQMQQSVVNTGYQQPSILTF